MWLWRVLFRLILEIFNSLQNTFFDLSQGYSSLQVIGPDAQRFLNGQLTNDVSKLGNGEFQLQARLDRGGKLQSFFYLLKEKENSFHIIIPKEFKGELCEDLERYIIMDDVTLESETTPICVVFSAYQNAKEEFLLSVAFKGVMGGFPAYIVLENHASDKDLNSELKKLLPEEFESLMVLQGEPLLGVNVSKDTLVTDTIVNLHGVSLEKGCFLGQETVAKIETRRGGAYFPVILKSENNELSSLRPGDKLNIEGKKAGTVLWVGLSPGGERLAVVSLLRDFRVKGRSHNFTFESGNIDAIVHYIPYEDVLQGNELTSGLFETAVKVFQEGNEEAAVKEFEEILKIDPKNEDSFEAIGVIFGRMERYQDGIDFMDKLLEANPNSVMAHTNKSLYFMKLGEIEKAEEEKAQATVKSFTKLGEEAQAKKKKEELQKQEEAEIERRFEMFNQVLEIDPDDALANYGLADIYFHRGEASKSIGLLKKVLEADEKYSVAYLLLGKSLVKEGLIQEAKEAFEKGIAIASKKGDLMPANEMQSKLLELNS